MFETVEYIEIRERPEPDAKVVAVSATEGEAIEAARAARLRYLENGDTSFGWWTVREQGADLALFIADSRSAKEFVLDLTSGQLVEV